MDLSAQSGQLDSLSNDDARKIIKRALNVLSSGKSKLELHEYSNGEVCITLHHGEVAGVIVRTAYGKEFIWFFKSCAALLKVLLKHDNYIQHWNASSCTYDAIDFTKTFGSTLEEARIKLDLAE